MKPKLIRRETRRKSEEGRKEEGK